MKAKQIRNRKDIPKSFSLKKYKPTFDFGIADWTVNFEARVLRIYTVVRHGDYYADEIKRGAEYI